MKNKSNLANLCALPAGEKQLFKLTGEKDSPAFIHRVEKEKPFVDKFCKKYNVKLVNVDVAMENKYFEPAYEFSDNLGYYTIKGIKNSLRS